MAKAVSFCENSLKKGEENVTDDRTASRMELCTSDHNQMCRHVTPMADAVARSVSKYRASTRGTRRRTAPYRAESSVRISSPTCPRITTHQPIPFSVQNMIASISSMSSRRSTTEHARAEGSDAAAAVTTTVRSERFRRRTPNKIRDARSRTGRLRT